MVIAPLSAAHDRALFDCGVLEMNVFLKQYARQNAQKDLSRTFVASPEEAEGGRIMGFYTLTAATVDFAALPSERLPPRYPVPVALLARLAVDNAFQKQGIGKLLLLDALVRAEEAAQRTGMFAVVVDALDENAAAFYAKFGFKQQNNGPLRLYMTMKTIRKVVTAVNP